MENPLGGGGKPASVPVYQPIDYNPPSYPPPPEGPPGGPGNITVYID